MYWIGREGFGGGGDFELKTVVRILGWNGSVVILHDVTSALARAEGHGRK